MPKMEKPSTIDISPLIKAANRVFNIHEIASVVDELNKLTTTKLESAEKKIIELLRKRLIYIMNIFTSGNIINEKSSSPDIADASSLAQQELKSIAKEFCTLEAISTKNSIFKCFIDHNNPEDYQWNNQVASDHTSLDQENIAANITSLRYK